MRVFLPSCPPLPPPCPTCPTAVVVGGQGDGRRACLRRVRSVASQDLEHSVVRMRKVYRFCKKKRVFEQGWWERFSIILSPTFPSEYRHLPYRNCPLFGPRGTRARRVLRSFLRSLLTPQAGEKGKNQNQEKTFKK